MGKIVEKKYTYTAKNIDSGKKMQIVEKQWKKWRAEKNSEKIQIMKKNREKIDIGKKNIQVVKKYRQWKNKK